MRFMHGDLWTNEERRVLDHRRKIDRDRDRDFGGARGRKGT